MSNTVASLVEVRTLGTGRRIFALERMRPIAVELGLDRVVALIDVALAADRVAWQLELAWRKQRVQKRARGEATRIDLALDRIVSALYRMLEAQTELTGEVSATAARTLLEELFPAGLQPVVQQRFEDALLELRSMIERVEGDLAPLVAAAGATSYLARIAELTERFGEELAKETGPALSFDELRAARDVGNLRIKQVVATVIADLPELTLEGEKKRARVLMHILDQARRASEARARTRTEVDVDPETGVEILDPPDDAGDDAEG